MMTFESFEADARAQGFPEVVERTWEPGAVADDHAHPFAFTALLVRGEMWLTVGDETRHLLPGDTFALDRDVPHAERYGSEGATYWVARRP
jgi:quercetin dioxygenase-like cupin family protein